MTLLLLLQTASAVPLSATPWTPPWFSERDALGVSHIGLAASTDSWSPPDIHTRICPQPGWW